jgi:predicted ATPase/DNA-binding SARP family transcriptional activator/DNA-binding CsgD family transcriptional regulator
MLGGFRVSVGPRDVGEADWRLKKAASLVKLLALAPGHALHREQVMEALWPGARRSAASSNLRQSLHAARGALHPDPAVAALILASLGERIALCPGGERENLWVDAEAFEEASAGARQAKAPSAYRAALDLYAGALVPEVRYEAWAEEPRARLRSTYLSLLSELAGHYEESQDLGSAEGMLWKLLAEEPADEGANASLMRLHAMRGRRGEALAQYGRLEGALSRGTGLDPSASVRALREEIAAGRYPPRDASHDTQRGEEVSLRHNITSPMTSFVGRERELLEVKRELASTRLLTLVGTGGAGKTRLAAEAARELAGAYSGGAWFVDLAPLAQGGLVVQEVAGALGVREQPGTSPEEALITHLREKELLLLLDNCEHVLDACAGLSQLLLGSCPGLKILATSRQALGLYGEVVWRVPPLSVPRKSSPADELMEFAAVRLLVERARLKLPSFSLTPENAAAVGKVCRGLEGVPLAVELAAARMGSMAAEHLAARLDDTLGLLTVGPRNAKSRQSTMRATLEWSHGLLLEKERIAFGRVSVFSGGFSLEAAEAVVAGEGIAEAEVLDLISSLVDKSLIVAELLTGPGQTPRYRMLAPVRQFALEHFKGDEAVESVFGRHAAFFLELAEVSEPHLKGPDQTLWLERLTRELDNLRTAMRWLLDVGEPGTVSRFGWALYVFWWIRGHFAEGRRWMEEVLANDHAMRPHDRARALYVAGTMAAGQADLHSTRAMAEESRDLFKVLGDEEGVALSKGTLGIAAASQKRYEEGIALLGEAAALHATLGYEWECAAITVMLAGAHLGLGDHERAAQKAEEGLALARKVGDALAASAALHVLATVASASGDRERARALFGEGLTLAAELGDKANVVYYLEELGADAASEGEPRRAARLWGAAETLLGATEATAYPHRSDGALHLSRVVAARARLEEESWAAAWSEGRSMSLERAVAYALSAEAPAPSASRGDCQRTRKGGPPEGDAVADGSPADSPHPGDTLTRREREVAHLVARGLTNREISSELSISDRTVETHVRNVLGKLELRSRTRLAARTIARGSLSETRG